MNSTLVRILTLIRQRFLEIANGHIIVNETSSLLITGVVISVQVITKGVCFKGSPLTVADLAPIVLGSFCGFWEFVLLGENGPRI